MEQDYMEYQDENTIPPRRIATMAMDVANVMTTSHTEKSHGGYNYYSDGMIEIRLDTYVPNLEILIIRDGMYTPVFRASHQHHESPSRYNPGRWCGHLVNLAETAREMREQRTVSNAVDKRLREMSRYSPVDDSDIFPGQSGGG